MTIFGLLLTIQAQAKPSISGRAWLGVIMHDDGRGGVLAQEVLPGSPARHAGLRNADRILRLGRIAITGPVDLLRVIAAKPVGDRVTLQVERLGRRMTLRVRLGRKPQHAAARPKPDLQGRPR